MSQSTPKKTILRLLTRREYSRRELLEKLQKKEFAFQESNEALDWAAENSYQSDQRFAESFTRFRKVKGFGPARIRQELGQKGIADDLIQVILAEHDWYAHAQVVRLKKFGQESPADYAKQAKQMRFLQYRGFSSDQIKAAVVEFVT